MAITQSDKDGAVQSPKGGLQGADSAGDAELSVRAPRDTQPIIRRRERARGAGRIGRERRSSRARRPQWRRTSRSAARRSRTRRAWGDRKRTSRLGVEVQAVTHGPAGQWPEACGEVALQTAIGLAVDAYSYPYWCSAALRVAPSPCICGGSNRVPGYAGHVVDQGVGRDFEGDRLGRVVVPRVLPVAADVHVGPVRAECSVLVDRNGEAGAGCGREPRARGSELGATWTSPDQRSRAP